MESCGPTTNYTTNFYEEMRRGARMSAEIIVPLVLQKLTVRSVIDVGCGDGTWLSVFSKSGVSEILGIDGVYVQSDTLQIPARFFEARDLSRPFTLPRTFDLAVSLEVAEHLPRDSAASFVESLTRLAPVVLFSAAIPQQGGNGHINEQWPEIWASHFQSHNFLPIDLIRKQVWQNDAVEWWYAQNTLLFVDAKYAASNAALKGELELTNRNQLSLVHPRAYANAIRAAAPTDRGVRHAFRQLLISLRNAAARRTLVAAQTHPDSDHRQLAPKD
jgi:SAM-dependent methyltransferase